MVYFVAAVVSIIVVLNVAEMVNARRLNMNSRDPDERRFINVVEEMSIASGTPVPELYMMDDELAINAFVAGYRPTEAVMVITRGGLETLSRAELQGVVAHEYSHILNGDMRINVRLIAALAGILILGQLGGFLLRSMHYSSTSRSSGKGGQGVMAMLAIGLTLFVVGYMGVFFGRLIKAAVSRQREFLADASSVQFTRNPEGIAGALWKIKTGAGRSHLESSHAEDMSHMCFGESLGFSSLLSTHPPVDDRIEVVSPGFAARRSAEELHRKSDPQFASESADETGSASGDDEDDEVSIMGVDMGLGGVEAVAVVASVTTAASQTESIGNPTPEHVAHAAQLYAGIPATLREAAHDEVRVRAVVYALFLAEVEGAERLAAVQMICDTEGDLVADDAIALVADVEVAGVKHRLPIVEIALPSLKSMGAVDRVRLLATSEKVINFDRRFTLFEFVLLTLLRQQLDRDHAPADSIKYVKFEQVLGEIRLLMTVLARVGARDTEQGEKTFALVMR
jgi:Zn-dependent protease with chaperone function